MLDHMIDGDLIDRWQRLRRDHLDFVTRNRGRVPQEMLADISAMRREGHQRGIDLEAIPPLPRPVSVIRRELRSIDRSMARLHSRGYTRAQATTREARLGQLARSKDALLNELRRAEERGESNENRS